MGIIPTRKDEVFVIANMKAKAPTAGRKKMRSLGDATKAVGSRSKQPRSTFRSTGNAKPVKASPK
jgi:hypothetical protein